jgi:hypothetical protein
VKLFVCLLCFDVVVMEVQSERQCRCGASKGMYVDNHIVEVDGPCKVVGFDNKLRYGTVDRAETWVIKEPHPKIRRKPPLGGPFSKLAGL